MQFIGIAMTVTFTMSMPMYWDENRQDIENNLGKQEGMTTIVIGYNPQMEGRKSSLSKLNNRFPDKNKWHEFHAVSYKDLDEMAKRRDEVLKILGEEKCK